MVIDHCYMNLTSFSRKKGVKLVTELEKSLQRTDTSLSAKHLFPVVATLHTD